MDEKPRISVLITHYNSGLFFKQAYDSLLGQTQSAWEAVIGDDCSTDGSWQLVKNLVAGDPRFKIFENTSNLGSAANFKKAIGLSSASLFARLDPDDTLTPDALEKSILAHEKHPNVGVVYSNHFVCDADLKIERLHYAQQVDDLTSESSFLYDDEIAQFGSFKKSFYNGTAGIDTFNKRAENVDIYLKMCEVAPVFHLNETLYNY